MCGIELTILSNPPQRSTGSGGYFGKAGLVLDSEHITNTDPRSDVMRRAWRQISQRPIIEGMFSSEAVTRGVRVQVLSEYAADRSDPANSQWFFLYTIEITNEG